MTSGIKPPALKEEGEISAAFMYERMIDRANGYRVHVRMSNGSLLCPHTNKQVGDFYIDNELSLHYAFYPTEEMIKESNV